MGCAACHRLLKTTHPADYLLARGRVVPATARWVASGAGPACGFAHIECHLVSPKVPFEFLLKSGFGSRQNRGVVPSIGGSVGFWPKNQYEKWRPPPPRASTDGLLRRGVTVDFSDLQGVRCENSRHFNKTRESSVSALPTTEAILLEIHQSFCGNSDSTKQKTDFASGQTSIANLKDRGTKILQDVFRALNLDPQAQMDALGNFVRFGNAYKFLELNTLTFAADQRQVLWALLGHVYVPGLARRVGFWSLEQALDKGMPGGRFWYLPEPQEMNGESDLYMPVAQVVDWLLDLLGTSTEAFSDRQSAQTDGAHEALRRSLYNWRDGAQMSVRSIEKYFSNKVSLDFKGVFKLKYVISPSEQFVSALEFVRRKGLTAEQLRIEISMTQGGLLEDVLAGNVNEDVQAVFVECLAERYAAPSMHTIRQRLLLARAVQDGYTRLLKVICPGVAQDCADAEQNKLLQLFAIYKLVYNLTVDAWRNCGDQGKAAENEWFEGHLPEWDKSGIFLSILPSRRASANQELARRMTRQFFEMQPGAELENYAGLNARTAIPVIKRNMERANQFGNEILAELHLVERIKAGSPWRALQAESRYWVVSQVAQDRALGPLAKQAAIQRMRELASTPSQTVQAIVLELNAHLNVERKVLLKSAQEKVQALLEEAEASTGYDLWKAAIRQCQAKHLLSCNDFEGAFRLFQEALVAGMERGFGPLLGEVGRDCLAIAVAIPPNGVKRGAIVNNYEKYYRTMLAGGIMADCEEIPSIEDAARWAYTYFWATLYKPYPGYPTQRPQSLEPFENLLRDLLPLFKSGDQAGLKTWIQSNRQLLKSNLPDVEGNSVLMALMKLHSRFVQIFPMLHREIPVELRGEGERFGNMLEEWKAFIALMIKESPKQLNIADLKGQTPLMLMAEDGDTEMVKILLQAGADPYLQDCRGMTALHSACKSRVDGCVDALLDYPRSLDKLTNEERSPLHTATWAGHLHAVNRLSELAPNLVYKRDSHGNTPLELAEHLLENPDALQVFKERRARDGKGCASKQELEAIVSVLEHVAFVPQ